jgi:hypothetical protein
VCEREGWNVVGVESDNDRSASRYAKRGRPGWDAVKGLITSGTIDVLVMWEASRSSRDLGGFVELRDLCRAHHDARWDALTIEQRREVVRLLFDVTVAKSTLPRGARGFDPDTVRVTPKV